MPKRLYVAVAVAGLASAAPPAHAQGVLGVLKNLQQLGEGIEAEDAEAKRAEMVGLVGTYYQYAGESEVQPNSRLARIAVAPDSVTRTRYNGNLADLENNEQMPGVPQVASAGQIAVARVRYLVRLKAVLREDLDWSPTPDLQYKLARGTEVPLVPPAINYCTVEKSGYVKGEPKKQVCLYDADNDGRFEQLSGIAKFSDKQTPPAPIAYAYKPATIVAIKARQVLTYLGRVGDIIRFQFQQQTANQLQPSAPSELTYTVAAAGNTVVKFQDVTLTITSIGNEGIRYTVDGAW